MRIIFAWLLVIQSFMLQASVPPAWIPVPNLQYNMNVIGKIQLSPGIYSINENDILGAFVGAECRGVASPIASLGGALFLTIGSNLLSGEVVTFKIFQASMGLIVNANETLPFQNGGETGTMANPFIFTLSFPTNTSLQGITIHSGQVNCYNASQTITVAGGGSSFVVQNGGSATLIAGQRILYLPNTSVQSGGYMRGVVAPNGPFCPTTPAIPALLTSQQEPEVVLVKSSFIVYPNPTTGKFILDLQGEVTAEKVIVDVYAMRGEKVLPTILDSERKQELSLSDQPAGVYFIRVITGAKTETAKIIKQ